MSVLSNITNKLFDSFNTLWLTKLFPLYYPVDSYISWCKHFFVLFSFFFFSSIEAWRALAQSSDCSSDFATNWHRLHYRHWMEDFLTCSLGLTKGGLWNKGMEEWQWGWEMRGWGSQCVRQQVIYWLSISHFYPLLISFHSFLWSPSS